MFKFWVSTWVLLSCASGYSASTLRVGSDQTYETIESAIQAAEANDTLAIGPGKYNEVLTIAKPLTIKGNTSARPVIIGHITVLADNVTLDQLEIAGWGVTAP